jgi:hypothetical protein
MPQIIVVGSAGAHQESPDGIKVELKEGTKAGQPGEVVVLSASVARDEIAAGTAVAVADIAGSVGGAVVED